MIEGSRQLEIAMAIFFALGLAAFVVKQGAPGAVGFATGAAAGYINYRLLRRTVASVGEPEHGAKRRRGSSLFLLRYGIVALLVYAMMKFFEISLLAVFAGLITPAAATLVAMIYELKKGT